MKEGIFKSQSLWLFACNHILRVKQEYHSKFETTPRLQSELQSNLGYRIRSCLKINQKSGYSIAFPILILGFYTLDDNAKEACYSLKYRCKATFGDARATKTNHLRPGRKIISMWFLDWKGEKRGEKNNAKYDPCNTRRE